MITISDIAASVCSPDLTIRDVMARINKMRPAQQFQIVVDGDGKAIGTVTDGDVRRAILRGAGLDESVTACMHTGFQTGTPGKAAANRQKLETLEANVRFLPVVGGDGRLVSILVADERAEPGVHALVMAGGFGRRLGERTRSIPKPLLPVGGTPILQHIFQRLETSGIEHMSVAVHYLADQIAEFVRSRPDGDRVEILREIEPFGTAGAIRLVDRGDAEDLLVLNGDILTSLQLDAFVGFHRDQNNDATVAAAMHEVRIPYGVVRCSESGAFQGIAEKPLLRHFVAAGIYLLSKRMCDLVPDDGPIDMPDLIQAGHDVGLKIGVFPIHEYWTDVGQPEDLDRADEQFTGK